MTSDIQRALEKQRKLDDAATGGPWRAKIRWDGLGSIEPDVICEVIGGTLIGKEDGALIAHARNQLALARAVIEAAASLNRELGNILLPESRWKILERAGLDDRLQAWADHVNGEET